jgi:polar amino acid transport system substrate-binding protein
MPAAAEELTVMAGPNPPYVLAKGLGVTGASVEAFEAIMKMNGLAFDRRAVKLMQWKRAYATTLAMPHCVMLDVHRTPDLEAKFQWVGPIDFPRLVLVGKADRDFGIRSVADASKYAIGAIRGKKAANELLAQGLDPAALKLSSTFVQPLRALQNGQLDLVAFSDENLAFLMRKLGLEKNHYAVAYVYKKVPLYFALSKGTDAEFIRCLNEALATYKSPMADGNSVFDKSMARYLPYGPVE